MIQSLQGRTVAVVGGGSGIGAAVAELARSEGATVLAISRTGAAPAGTRGVAADVGDGDALSAAFASAGRIDHLVYTAGPVLGSVPLTALDDETLPQAFEVKLFGALRAARLALAHLSGDASITLTSGQVSRKHGVGSFVKGSLNAAIDSAGRHLAKELAPRRVNVVSPGVVDTDQWGPMGSEARSATLRKLGSALPVGRVGTAEQLAQAYLFVMTNGFVTGALIDVNGGSLL